MSLGDCHQGRRGFAACPWLPYFAPSALRVIVITAARLRRLPLATLFRAFGAASDRYNGGAAFAACPWLTYFAPSAL